jgi:hypothetical protein
VIVGITAEHCGSRCLKECAIRSVHAVNADSECSRLGVRAILGDTGPWNLSHAQREAVESAMDGAHLCDISAARAALTVRG